MRRYDLKMLEMFDVQCSFSVPWFLKGRSLGSWDFGKDVHDHDLPDDHDNQYVWPFLHGESMKLVPDDWSVNTSRLFGTPDKSSWFWVGHAQGMNTGDRRDMWFILVWKDERAGHGRLTVSPGASCTAYWQGRHLLTNTDTNESNESRSFGSTWWLFVEDVAVTLLCTWTVNFFRKFVLLPLMHSGSQGSHELENQVNMFTR